MQYGIKYIYPGVQPMKSIEGRISTLLQNFSGLANDFCSLKNILFSNNG